MDGQYVLTLEKRDNNYRTLLQIKVVLQEYVDGDIVKMHAAEMHSMLSRYEMKVANG